VNGQGGRSSLKPKHQFSQSLVFFKEIDRHDDVGYQPLPLRCIEKTFFGFSQAAQFLRYAAISVSEKW